MTLNTIMSRYDVDRFHARHVADMALALFDATKDVHGLSNRMRQLLETGALLHNVAMHIDQPMHHIVGRDIVLDVAIPELDEEEQAIVACLVAFHRKKVHPEIEPAYLRLRKKDQQYALRLAAILRVADGLDYSESQTTQLQTCKITNSQVALQITGPQSAEDGARALKKADLWRKVLRTELAVASDGQPGLEAESTEQPGASGNGTGPTDEPPGASEEPAVQAKITPYDTLAEVGRRFLRSNLQKLLEQEQGVREGKDPEAVHDMRVATRRLRAILQIIHDIGPDKQIRYYRKELQHLAQMLSPVRDADVFLHQVERYIAGLPETFRNDAVVLAEAIKRDRAEGRTLLLAYLDSARYANLKRDFSTFITDRPKDWNTTLRVRDLAGSHIWRRYEELRAHEAHINLNGNLVSQSDALHQMRIAGKRLRYVLEMYAEPLGPESNRSLKVLMHVQDHLGDLQDIAVATAYVKSLEVNEVERIAMESYLVAREAERTHLIEGLSGCWEQVLGEAYRRDLALLIAGL